MFRMPSLQSPNDLKAIGEQLASHHRWRPYVESLDDGMARNWTAILLENQYAHYLAKGVDPERITETTKVLQIGNFDKYAFPIIRAVYPNLITNEIATVQPMAGPVSLVFYFDILFGDSKGNQTQGNSAFDSITGPVNSEFYSSNVVPSEVANIDGSKNIDHTLAFTPVVPGTVRVTAVAGSTTFVLADDGAGTLVFISGSDTITSGTVNYSTGRVVLDLANNDIDSATITYEYANEATDNIGSMDIQLTSAPVMARVRKLKFRFSLEAAQNLNALHGLDADAELVEAISQWIRHEQDREVINDIFTNAAAGHIQWDRSIPPAVSWTKHKESLVDAFARGSNLVFSKTKRAQTNWIVMGIDVASIVETLPSFTPAANAFNTQSNTGVIEIGTVAGRWRCFKDPFFPTTKWVMGYKGSSFLDTGYVFAPYIPLYSTPTVVLDDFMARRGVGTQYGTKVVNPNFYSTGEIVNL